ncbi:hypothetical protein [Thermoplasma sp. Kam2015]|nr:hypothetical protein [Thermoplasma sp. Kam2015]
MSCSSAEASDLPSAKDIYISGHPYKPYTTITTGGNSDLIEPT